MSEAEREELPAKIDRARERVAELRSIVPTPPTLEVDGRLVIDGGDRRVVLLPFRAHTRGDLVVHLPDDGVLVTGDLLDDLPFGGHGYPTSWVETLDSLEALGAGVVIPGHGPVFRGGEQLGLVRDLLRAAIAVAGDGEAKAGAEAELERVRQAMVGDDPLAAEAWEAFVPELLERAAAEAEGTLDGGD